MDYFNTSLNFQNEQKPSQVYQDKQGLVHYGPEAKAKARQEWHEQFNNDKYKKVEMEIDHLSVIKTIKNEEVVRAALRLKKKGTGWDCIPY